MDNEGKVIGYSALFEILIVLKRELCKEKSDEIKYSHFLCTLERSYQEKLKMAIIQLKCVPCLNKFTATSFNLLQQSPSTQNLHQTPNKHQQQQQVVPQLNSIISNGNLNRLLKQMSLIVSTELHQIAIDIIERYDDDLNCDKPVKYIRLKDEFKYQPSSHHSHQTMMMNSNNNNNIINNQSSSNSHQVSAPISIANKNAASIQNASAASLMQENQKSSVNKSNPSRANNTPAKLPPMINPLNYLNKLTRETKISSDYQIKSVFTDHNPNAIYSTGDRF